MEPCSSTLLIDLEAKSSPGPPLDLAAPRVGLHLVGLTAFAFASYWNVGAVTGARPQRRLLRRRPAAAGDPARWRRTAAARADPRPQPAPVPETQTVQPDLDDMPDNPPAPASGPTQESTFPGTDPTAPPGPGDPNGDTTATTRWVTSMGRPAGSPGRRRSGLSHGRDEPAAGAAADPAALYGTGAAGRGPGDGDRRGDHRREGARHQRAGGSRPADGARPLSRGGDPAGHLPAGDAGGRPVKVCFT